MAHEQRRFAERFQVEALVASGGMGMVFRGRDLLDGQPVALKVLRRQGYDPTERFFREAEALAALSHPAIVRYVAHGATLQGEPYLVMEWLNCTRAMAAGFIPGTLWISILRFRSRCRRCWTACWLWSRQSDPTTLRSCQPSWRWRQRLWRQPDRMRSPRVGTIPCPGTSSVSWPW